MKKTRYRRIDQQSPPITKPGDIWVLDKHRIVCGDALQAENYSHLLGDDRAEMVFTDPPWNIPIEGMSVVWAPSNTLSSRWRQAKCHRPNSKPFLRPHSVMPRDTPSTAHSISSAMDWRHIKELLGATADLYTEMKNLCIWNKSNWRHGIALPVEARTGVRVQARKGRPHQQHRTWSLRPTPQQRMGLSRTEYAQQQRKR